MGDLDVAPPVSAPAGSGADGAQPVVSRGPGLRPAMIVVGLALLIVVLFGVGSALSGSGSGTTSSRTTTPTVPAGHSAVAGTTLLAEPAAKALAAVAQPGTPPANIVDSLAVPVGATRVAKSPSTSITLFDANEHFTVPGTQEAVIDFYRTELAAMKWKVTDVGAASGAPDANEVLAQKAGSDGWFWEVGVVVSPTTFGSTAGAAAATGTTPFELRLFQINDPD